MRELLILVLCLSFGGVKAQEVMKVRRAAAIDRNVAIYNVYVNEKGNRWVADAKGVFLVQSPEFANPIAIDASEWALLSAPDGNEELKLPKANFERLMGQDVTRITTAYLDRNRQELWVGTKNEGLYHFKTNPQLELIGTLTTKNSKLRSDAIQTILATPNGHIWVGTYDGLLEIEDGKDKAYAKFFSIEAIANWEGEIWAVSDGEVLKMDRKGDFYAFEIASRMVEGKVKDIAFDSRGNLWIASEIVVRYHFDTEKYDLFGPAQEFTSQFVNCIAVDQDDALWVGTNDKGVYYIGKAASITAELILETPLSCEANAKNAALKVLASGGQPPYTYKWTGGLKGENPKNLGSGTYSLTITDQKGQTVEVQKVIQDNSLTISVSQQKPASLGGNADGQAAVTVSPESAKYRYQWNNGEQGRIANKLSVGEHQVTVTGENGCTSVAKIVIAEALAPLTVALEQSKANSCSGTAEAELKATTTGGQGPYVYQWSQPNLKGAQALKLSPGDYQITVTDAAGNTATAQIKLPEPKAITASISPKSPATTNQANGKAKVSAEGGSGKFTYLWDTNETGETAEKLTAGAHSVTITDEAGCTTTASINITEDILPLNVELAIVTPINCAGESSANLVANVTGGKAPFKYQWSTDKGVNEKASGLAAGKYQLTVTDAEGTSKVTDVNMSEPRPLSLKIKQSTPASTGKEDGEAKASVEGGSGDYAYTWDNGEATATATRLSPGKHQLTVLDKNGCGISGEIDITEDIPALSVDLAQRAVIKCFGEKTATLAVEIQGGKAPYQYQWNVNGLSGAQASNLAAGKFVVTVTDVSGLSQVAEINVEEPKPLTLKLVQSAPASTGKSDGKAKASVEGGSGDYAYTWDNGEATATATKLSPGKHQLTVLDKNGCGISGEVDITEDILALSVDLAQRAVIKCFGEKTAALAVEVQGGKAPYQYQWNANGLSGAQASNLAAGKFVVTVTDVSGLSQVAEINVEEPKPLTLKLVQSAPASTSKSDGKAKASVEGGSGDYAYTWDNGEATATASKLNAGKHQLTVLDKNGCGVSGEIDITENILALNVSLVQKAEIKCGGEKTGALAVEVQGGKPPYQYQWNASGLSGAQADKLSAGDYTVTVTDASGLSQAAEISIAQPQTLTLKVQQSAPASTGKSDGQAKVVVEGGKGGYDYTWDNGEASATATKLAAGKHKVTALDKNGCGVSGEIDITENIQALKVILVQKSEIKCAGEQTAALEVVVEGGKPPYQYQWNNGGSNGAQANNLAPGEYAVTVSDASGLSQQAQVSVKTPEPLAIDLGSNKPATNEDSKDGKASLSIKGGSPAYTVNWDNGETGTDAKSLPAGDHSVSVTDAKGCSASLNFKTGKKILPDLTAGRLSAGQTLQVSQIFFEADSTNMQPESFPVLEEIAAFLEENPLVVIEVGGHTNNQPPPEFCDALSTARAKAAALYIVQQGVDPSRVVYKGYGKREPKFSNATSDGRRRNQRVEIKILRLN